MCIRDRDAGDWGEVVGKRASASVGCVKVPLTSMIAGAGAWLGRDVVLCGPESQVAEMEELLLEVGADAEAITVLAHDAVPPWLSGL